ncbi:ABC transporter substrate-binding protein [Nocardia callitridis]|uniref:ABC transporter substrate-binding protein n=1 Tax=Nocardia callitridis TaxID=648753 RepID=A0ABP9KAE3_9NOCA
MRQAGGVTRLIGALVASALAGAAVTGCSSEDQVPSIGYAVDATLATYNGATALGASSGSAAVFGRVLTGFFYTGPAGQQVADTDLGTAKEVPGEAQTIQYRLNPASTYSDGVPTSCDDLVLAWAAHSGKYTKPGEHGEVPLFDAATTAGYSDIERVDCQPGSKDATVVFRPDRHYLPWRTLFAAGELMPAHVAARAANVSDVVTAVSGADPSAIGRVAEFWNTGWKLEPGDIDIANFPSSGPYRIESYSAEDGLVLVANERWWGEKPETPRIVVWPKGVDVQQKIADNAVGVVDVGMGSVNGLQLDGFTAQDVPSRGAEQLTLATGGVFGSADLRRAFALCVPRQQLFNDVGRAKDAPPNGLGSGPLNAHVVQQDSLYYAAVTGGANKYANPDVGAAIKAASASGTKNPTVRIGYQLPDDRRARTVSIIAEACKPAGINVVDAGSPEFTPAQLTGGQVDAVLGGTASAPGPSGSADGVAATSALVAGDGLNFGSYANGRYDTITNQLAADDDSATKLSLLTEAENVLWADLPSIPLFATPRTIAFHNGLRNGVAGPTQAGSGWNMDRWVLTR